MPEPAPESLPALNALLAAATFPPALRQEMDARLRREGPLLTALAAHYEALEAGRPVRPTLGNDMPIHYGRDRQTYAFLLLPELRRWGYEVARVIGRLWEPPDFDAHDLPTLMRQNEPIPARHRYARCEVVTATQTEAFYRMHECADCYGLPDLGLHLCVYEAGTCAGMLERQLGRAVEVVETKCCAHGDPFCEFHVKVT